MAVLRGSDGGSTKDEETDGSGTDLGSDGPDPFLVNQTNAAVALEQQGHVDIEKSDPGDTLSFDVDTDPSDSGTTGGGGPKDNQDRQTENTQDPTQNNDQVKRDSRPGPAVVLQTGGNGGQPNQQAPPQRAPNTAPPAPRRRRWAAWGNGEGGDSGGSSGLIIAGIVGLLALVGGLAVGGS